MLEGRCGIGTEILSRRITYGNFSGNGQVILEPEITQRRSKRGNRQGGQVNREAWKRLRHQSLIQYLTRSHCMFLIMKVASKIFRCCISIMINDLLSLMKIWSNLCLHAYDWPFTLEASWLTWYGLQIYMMKR